MASDQGDIFANCTQHFSLEKHFQNCYNTSDQCDLIEDISTAYSILLWFGFYIPSAICSVAVLLDLYCFIVTICIYRDLQNEARKHYVFLLMRISSSFFCAICIISFQSTAFFTNAPYRDSFTFYAVMFTLYDFSIFSLLGSFIGVALITYLGVLKPTVYRNTFTLKVMWSLAAGTWILAVCIAVPVGLFQAAGSVDGPIECESHTCKLLIKWLVFGVCCVILFASLSTLVFVTISLYWHNYKSKKLGNLTFSPTDHGRSRLAFTTALFVTFCFVELVPTGLLVGFEDYGFLNSCDSFYRANHLILPAVISSFESFLGSIMFFFDPITNLFFDRHISKFVGNQMRSMRFFRFCRAKNGKEASEGTH